MNGIDAFVPLVRNAKGEDVPLSELKIVASKAIEVMISKLDPDDNTID